MPNNREPGSTTILASLTLIILALVYPVSVSDARGDTRHRWQFAETWPIETGDGPQMELIRWEGNCFLLINGRRASGPFVPHRCPVGMPAEPYDPFQEAP